MQDAVIVSTARTPIAKAFRGAFNDLKSPSMAAVALRAAVERAGIEAAEIEDVVMGTAMQGGTASTNLGRLSLLAAGLPLSVSGQTIDRQCASGLMAISIAAKQIMVDGMAVTVGAGQEQISLVQNTHMKWTASDYDPAVVKMAEHAYMPMLQTAELVAKRYGISREAQDAYSLQSQQRTADAQAAGHGGLQTDDAVRGAGHGPGQPRPFQDVEHDAAVGARRRQGHQRQRTGQVRGLVLGGDPDEPLPPDHPSALGLGVALGDDQIQPPLAEGGDQSRAQPRHQLQPNARMGLAEAAQFYEAETARYRSIARSIRLQPQ